MEKSILTRNQKKTLTKRYTENGIPYIIEVDIRYDDQCGNGHNSFSITGTVYEKRKAESCLETCGCIHEEIAKHFPELERYIKWHLCSSDGPMHYIANTLYHASDKDCWGMRKGEFKQHKNKEGLLQWHISGGRETPYSAEKPEPAEYEPYGKTGEGKEIELDAARNSAIWPDATQADFTEDRLKARLPRLLEDFRAAILELGFTW